MPDDEGEENGVPASVRARLGNLEIEVEGEDLETAERVFEDVWERRLEETEESIQATRTLSRGHR